MNFRRLSLALAALLMMSVSVAPGALRAAPTTEKAVFAGGCFWGIEGVFESLKGVTNAVSGYAGGSKATANYEAVSSEMTGHAESVEVTFDPSRISYQQLLDVFFTVAHDPTELNRQGPDTGTSYRSEIFFENDAQRAAAQAMIAKLTAAKKYPAPIVTKVEPLKGFYPAEAMHQHFMQTHPDYPYIVYNDAPKLVALKKTFPDLVKRT